jgi:hypothetical protein
MKFSIEKAVQRFGWNINQGRLKANENDIEAYNTIVDYVKEKQSSQIINQELFAKLYIHVYGQFLIHYNSDVFNQEPKKELNKILFRSLDDCISEFYTLINQIKVDRDVLNAKEVQDIQKIKITPYNEDYVSNNIIEQVNEVILKHSQWKG